MATTPATTDPGAPADTTMMRVVHDALRRDVERLSSVLGNDLVHDPKQRAAIARHVTWMMDFLHAHHSGEEEGLFPAIRERRPEVAVLLDDMDRDHSDLAAAVARVLSAAADYREGGHPQTRSDLGGALDDLRTRLDPHLRREEDELLPVASSCLTHGEWTLIEQEHFVRTKSMHELGLEGHWLIDEADEADRATVLGVVPAVPRFVLLHGLASTYRRQRDAWWRPERRRRRIPHHMEVTVDVEAPIDAVWDIVRDPTRVGEWSGECVSAELLDGAPRAAVGTRFRGRNRQGLVRWARVCEVIEIDRYRFVWRTVPTPFTPDSSRWALQLEPTATGTRIEQRYDIVKGPGPLEAVYATILPQHRDREAALQADLRRLGEIAARRPTRSVTGQRR